MSIATPNRLRMAELASGLGALVLGVGIGVLSAERLAGFGLLLLLTGAAVHSWGMLDHQRQKNRAGEPDVWWGRAAYWTCWALLVVLAFGIAGRFAGSI